jgi:hypothetical protein
VKTGVVTVLAATPVFYIVKNSMILHHIIDNPVGIYTK